MKAIVYKGVRSVAAEDVSDPRLENEDDIIVKATSTAIRGSDLHLIHGCVERIHGYVLDYEAIGSVEEAGKGIKNVRKGDRVIVTFPAVCGHCAYCETEKYNQCDNSDPNGEAGGLSGYSEPLRIYVGGHARHLRDPYANVGPVKAPEGLRDKPVFIGTDILPTSRWSVDIAGVKKGNTVVVLGRSLRALLMIKWAFFLGTQRARAADNVGYRLEHAKGYGVEVLNFKNCNNAGLEIKGRTRGGVDMVIDCVGMDGKMSTMEKVKSALKMQAGYKSAIKIASEAVQKCGTVAMPGGYSGRYNTFPLGNFFDRNITLKMGQCPAHRYVRPKENFILTGIITLWLRLCMPTPPLTKKRETVSGWCSSHE